MGSFPLRAQERPAVVREAGFPSAESSFADPEARAAGAALLERVIDAAGGEAAFRALPGLRWQVLEILRVEVDRAQRAWRVHSYVPRACAFDLEGRGWMLSEYVAIDPVTHAARASYRREVRGADAAWAEMDQRLERSDAAARGSERALARELFLGTFPLSLSLTGASAARAGRGELSGKRLDGLWLRLARPVILDQDEAVSELLLFVDPEGPRGPIARQLHYELVAGDRDDFESPATRGLVDFEGVIALGPLSLPAARHLWHAGGQRSVELATAEAAAAVLAAESIAPPWVAGRLWTGAARAYHWDPPR